MHIDPAYLWEFLPRGYLLTVAVELPIMLVLMSRTHSPARRVWLGFWLTAFTYPIVVLVLPLAIWPRWGELTYVAVAETFAPLAECWLFSLAYAPGLRPWRDWGVIVLANIASFSVGELF